MEEDDENIVVNMTRWSMGDEDLVLPEEEPKEEPEAEPDVAPKPESSDESDGGVEYTGKVSVMKRSSFWGQVSSGSANNSFTEDRGHTNVLASRNSFGRSEPKALTPWQMADREARLKSSQKRKSQSAVKRETRRSTEADAGNGTGADVSVTPSIRGEVA